MGAGRRVLKKTFSCNVKLNEQVRHEADNHVYAQKLIDGNYYKYYKGIERSAKRNF